MDVAKSIKLLRVGDNPGGDRMTTRRNVWGRKKKDEQTSKEETRKRNQSFLGGKVHCWTFPGASEIIHKVGVGVALRRRGRRGGAGERASRRASPGSPARAEAGRGPLVPCCVSPGRLGVTVRLGSASRVRRQKEPLPLAVAS